MPKGVKEVIAAGTGVPGLRDDNGKRRARVIAYLAEQERETEKRRRRREEKFQDQGG